MRTGNEVLGLQKSTERHYSEAANQSEGGGGIGTSYASLLQARPHAVDASFTLQIAKGLLGERLVWDPPANLGELIAHDSIVVIEVAHSRNKAIKGVSECFPAFSKS